MTFRSCVASKNMTSYCRSTCRGEREFLRIVMIYPRIRFRSFHLKQFPAGLIKTCLTLLFKGYCLPYSSLRMVSTRAPYTTLLTQITLTTLLPPSALATWHREATLLARVQCSAHRQMITYINNPFLMDRVICDHVLVASASEV
jgi:hypothetical protein